MTTKKDKKLDYEVRQAEKLHEKVKAYSSGEIDRYNIVRNLSYAMQEIAKKKLSGSKKKEIVRDVVMKLLNPNSFPAELIDTMIDNFIEDIYTSFTKTFTRGRCC